MVHLILVLDRLLRVTTKKGRQFLDKKVHLRQNPGYAYNIRQLSTFHMNYDNHTCLYRCSDGNFSLL